MADDAIAYDKADLRKIIGAFKGMDDEAVAQAKGVSNSLAEYLQEKIREKAGTLRSSNVASRIADGSRVSKSSKVGEIGFGYVAQKFSGGATTQTLWGGSEFGSNRYKQFPVWSGRQGRGSRGWFIYPTLRAEQPHIINEWENAFSKIAKEW
jgi:hypothetical protein